MRTWGIVGVGLLFGCSADSSGNDAGQAQTEGIDSVGDTEGASSSSATAAPDGSGSADGDEDSGLKYDIGGLPDAGTDCGTGEGGGLTFSHIWIANTPDGTVSKINTKTGIEEGRYRTGETTNTDPSRTSVNLLGDVAVLNRAGGSVVKIAAREERCVDANNDGAITTSTGPDDVLAWGTDECVAWTFDMFTGARAVAWDTGNDPQVEGCPSGAPKLWISAMDENLRVVVWRLDGQTGDVEGTAEIEGWDDPDWGGLYGGATDRDRDFWAVGKENAALVRVDYETFEVERFDVPDIERFYGIAMDADGAPWIASEYDDTLFRFDPVGEVFENKGQTGHGSLRGLAVDKQGDAWIAANDPCALVHYDRSAQTMNDVALPGCGTPVGVSIDVDGFVWVVDQGSSRAYKVDPSTYDVALEVEGLSSPYTYSDMTGAGLGLVSQPPG